MDKEGLQIFFPTLLPESNEPGKSHGEENKGTDPELHPDNFFQVLVNHEEGKYTESRYHDTDETLREEGEAGRNIEEDVTQQFFSVTVRQVSSHKKAHAAYDKER